MSKRKGKKLNRKKSKKFKNVPFEEREIVLQIDNINI